MTYNIIREKQKRETSAINSVNQCYDSQMFLVKKLEI